MGRALMYAVIAALAVFVLTAAFVLQRGGGSIEAAAEVSVHDLSAAPEAHAGQRISTEGVLRRVEKPEEHFLVTAEGLGIVVRGYGVEALRRLDGQTVKVDGRFGLDAATGVYIEAERVTPLY